MCNVCCKEFQGWCRAFTATEVILSILQAILLTLLVSLLTFVILHLVVCSDDNNRIIVQPNVVISTETSIPEGSISSSVSSENVTIWSTVPPAIACTWTPSAKTRAITQYFEQVGNTMNVTDVYGKSQISISSYDNTTRYDDGVFVSDQFDGKPAGNEKYFIMALVKLRPPDDITFGCILTIISEFWTLTAASCIESIEEIDSLDSFVMMEGFGEPRHGKTHRVSNVFIHPEYQGTDNTYDIVALKSNDKLTSRGKTLKLPTVLDYLVITIGERLTIMGYGKFRSIHKDVFTRGAHVVPVHVLPSSQCAGLGGEWSARHLASGGPVARARCGSAGLCAGPLYARGTPCNYCAGTPLVQSGVLFGLMSAAGPCGAPCEPALYANLVVIQDWLNFVLADN